MAPVPREKPPTHEEALALLAARARDGHVAAAVAYERAMWREERDKGDDAKKNRGKKSAAQGVLDDLNDTAA